jgi:hypothetical protein
MLRKHFLSSGLLMSGLFAVIVLPLDGQAKEARPDIPESQMMSFCRGEAASALKLSPRDISTLPVERSGDNYRVYGQSPSQGDNALFFYCEFNKHREFDKVTKTSDKRSSDSDTSSGEVVSLADMPNFCKGMAAEKFQESPRRITTNKPSIQSDGSYLVYGQYDLADTQIQAFKCKFSPKKQFVNVHKNR